MFLLILSVSAGGVTLYSFTFHNVSINTIELKYEPDGQKDFTFHNVSINTDDGCF